MKNVLKVTALSLALALTASFAHAEENIAFINSAYVFQNHPDRKAVAERLEAEDKAPLEKLTTNKKSIEEKIAANRKNLDTKVAALQKDAKDPKKRPSELQKREEEINKLAQTYQEEADKLIRAHDEEAQKFQVESEQRNAAETEKLLESIRVATDKVAKEKKYTLVLDANAVVFATDNKNISDEVLKAIPVSTAPAAK